MDRYASIAETLRRLKRDYQSRLRLDMTETDGDDGSGHWGHTGRPGARGGSAPGGGVAHRLAAPSGGYTSAAKTAAAERAKMVHTRMHKAAEGEIVSIPMNAAVRVKGLDGTWYNDGLGGLISPDGRALGGSELQGKSISYDVPKYQPCKTTHEQALDRYRGGGVDPQEKTDVHMKVYTDMDGLAVQAENGKTYAVYDGLWFEVGPTGRGKLAGDDCPGKYGPIEGTVTGNCYDLALKTKGLAGHSVDELTERMKDCPEPLRAEYVRAFIDKRPRVVGGDVPSQFIPYYDRILLSKNSSGATIMHEYAHYMDGTEYGDFLAVGSSRAVMDAMTREQELADLRTFGGSLQKKFSINENGEFFGRPGMRGAIYAREMSAVQGRVRHSESAAAVSDIISAMTGNQFMETRFGGHEAEYWAETSHGKNTGNNRYAEAWADFCTLKARGESEAIAYLEEKLPNLMGAMNARYGEVYGSG